MGSILPSRILKILILYLKAVNILADIKMDRTIYVIYRI